MTRRIARALTLLGATAALAAGGVGIAQARHGAGRRSTLRRQSPGVVSVPPRLRLIR